ncbi:MAG: threonine synthase [Chloroflexi bacterium]|nr:threonine synthase [Chloroflexota bacterium]
MHFSFLAHLECSHCGETYDHLQPQAFCPSCNTPLLARYDLAAARAALDRDELRAAVRGMWRWHALLPVLDPANIVTLGEGDCPLLPLPRLGSALGMERLYVKDESSNPTGTFKARGLAAAVSKAVEVGKKRLIVPSAGNAGGALAAYAARAGLEAAIYLPDDSPDANIIEAGSYGAELHLVDGLISDCAALVRQRAESEPGWWDVSTFKEPYRVEGKKVMGYELAEAFDWTLPDVIVYPTGGGTGLVGMWKAFHELKELGWLKNEAMPRMVAVQAEGCAPVPRAFEQRAGTNQFWEGATTIASGLRVPKSFADRLIMQALYESNGTAIAVSDETLTEGAYDFATCEGIAACPEGGATLAALRVLVDQGWAKPHERVVLFNTGTALKYQ